MKAVREGRVHNWRWIDRFDVAQEDYQEHELLYRVDECEARKAQRPFTPEEQIRLMKKLERVRDKRKRAS